MGAWNLRPFGTTLLTTNQSESYNAILKLTKDNSDRPVSAMVIELMLDADKYLSKIAMGRLRMGGTFTLLEHLRKNYDKTIVNIPKPVDTKAIMEQVKNLNPVVSDVWHSIILFYGIVLMIKLVK